VTADTAATTQERIEAVGVLALGRDHGSVQPLLQLIRGDVPVELRRAARGRPFLIPLDRADRQRE
jgi:hypothetical protein